MLKSIKIILLVTIICWVLYSLLFQVRRRTGDDIPIDPMVELANTGDFTAIKNLRQRYIDRHQFGMADYWLYIGALNGEPAMMDEYLHKFRSMSEKEKQAELQSIRTSTASQEQKNSMLSKLTGDAKQ
ncbi:hypothetical protein [Undibacterium sp. TJN19]|uniref:hypothetical protein n=1 Tax=Undibacterium sp. TJN19 TaxID=3413055 RepID=UPI003BF365D7